MAVAFTASTHRLQKLSPAVTPGPTGTISLWLRPNWAYNDGVAHAFWTYWDSTGGTSGWELSFQKFSDNNIYIGWRNSTGDQRITISGSGCFVSGQWDNHIFTWDDSANDEKYYVGNVQKGSRTAALTTGLPAYDEFDIGNYAATLGNANANAVLHDYFEWSVVLDEGERKAIAAGFDPRKIRPDALIRQPSLDWRDQLQPRDFKTGELFTMAGGAYHDAPRFAPTDRTRQRRRMVAAGGTTYNQACDATSMAVAALLRSVGKPLTVLETAVATLVRQTAKPLDASQTGVASLSTSRATLVSLLASSTGVATLARATAKALAATSTAAAALLRQTGKPTTASSTSTATATKQTAKALTATQTGVATLAAIRAFLLSLTASSTGVATIARQTGKPITASSTAVATLARATAKALTATSTSAASAVKSIAKAFGAASTSLASLVATLLEGGAKVVTATASETLLTAATASDARVILATASEAIV